jgi:hypothetical protein
MLESLGVSALKGLAKSLGNRLVASPGNAVSVKALADEIAALRVEQHQSQLATMAILTQFAQIIGQVNGLVLSGNGSVITYRQTEQSPTLGDALLLLHQRINALEQAVPPSAPPVVVVVRPDTQSEPVAARSPALPPSPAPEQAGAEPPAKDTTSKVLDNISKKIEELYAQGGEQK